MDTLSHSAKELRTVWIDNGPVWSSSVDNVPENWNPWLQLILAGHGNDLPYAPVDLQPLAYTINRGMANLLPSQSSLAVQVR